MSERRLYASRTVRWRDGSYFVVTAPTEWVRVYMDEGVLGDYARWVMSPSRPRSMQREVFGERTVVPGPWPFGLKVIDGPRLHFGRVSFIAELGGLALAAWAVCEVLRRREEGT